MGPGKSGLRDYGGGPDRMLGPLDWREPPVPEELKTAYEPVRVELREAELAPDPRLGELEARVEELELRLAEWQGKYASSVSQNEMLRRANAGLMRHLRQSERTVRLLNRAIDDPSLLDAPDYPT